MADGPPRRWYHQIVEERLCFGVGDFGELNLCSYGLRSLFNHSFIDVDSFKQIFKQNDDFNEALRQNCERKEFYSCLLAFDKVKFNQSVEGWFKTGRGDKSGNTQTKKGEQGQQGESENGGDAVKKNKKKNIHVHCMFIRLVWMNVGTGRREEVGLSVGWEGD